MIPERYMNAYCGHEGILKAYTGIKLPYVLLGAIQHGWAHGFVPWFDLDGRNKHIQQFVWTEKVCSDALLHGYRATAIGAPFLYLPPVELEKEKPYSLLLFPTHSTDDCQFADIVARFYEYVKSITRLQKEFSSITACLHWHNYQNEKARNLFQSHGIDTVTLGPQENQHFLYDYCDLVQKYEYVSSDSLISAPFYALYMRKKVFIFGRLLALDDYVWPTPEGVDRAYVEKTIWDSLKLYPELRYENFDGKSHHEIGEYELGLSNKCSPQELRDMFGWHISNISRQLWPMTVCTTASHVPKIVKQSLRKVL